MISSAPARYLQNGFNNESQSNVSNKTKTIIYHNDKPLLIQEQGEKEKSR